MKKGMACQGESPTNRNHSGGGWTHVVLSEPLNGDFQERIFIGRMELQARSEASSVWGINAER
jgi:hypothetical protein